MNALATCRGAPSAEAGFTLIEALIALAVVGVCLGAIGALTAANLRAVRQVDQRVALVSALRKIEAALPERAKLAADLSGEMGGQRFAIISRPDPDPSSSPGERERPAWTPQSLTIRIEGSSGARLDVETVRLVPATGR